MDVASGDGADAGRPRSFLRRHWIGAIALVGLLATAGFGIARWATRSHAPDYTDQTRHIELTFDCTNAIFWTDPASSYRWWAGDPAPVPASNFDTSPPTKGSLAAIPVHHVSGILHFDTASRATFVSDAGGRLPMTREPRHVLHTMECAIDPSDASLHK